MVAIAPSADAQEVIRCRFAVIFAVIPVNFLILLLEYFAEPAERRGTFWDFLGDKLGRRSAWRRE